MKDSRIILLSLRLILMGTCSLGTTEWNPDRAGDQCEAAIKETILADRATAADNTPSRLYATWLSQECEIRTGPEYVIRKYTFFENGTFFLMRHHYAEESCSVATHTVTARGTLRLLSPSAVTPGATEARVHLDTVHVVPLNRQVAHKFGHRVNVSCSPQPRWRPYVPQLIYEQRRLGYPLWEGPRYNSLQGHPPSRNHRGINCMEPLGIDFSELKLLRVQKKPMSSTGFGLGSSGKPRVELFLASLPPNVPSRQTYKPTSLQPAALLRIDTTSGCLVCSTIARGTETSPPVLHEVAALPALLGGAWLSSTCESFNGGLWIKRQLQIYSGDKLWTGRWDYYADPRCSMFLYAISAAGSYVQRAGRHRRDRTDADIDSNLSLDDIERVYPDSLALLSINNADYTGTDSKNVRNLYRKKRSFMKDTTDLKELMQNPLDIVKVDSKEDLYLMKSLRQKKALEEWMTQELARKIFDMYGMKRGKEEEMLPTIEEIKEAKGTSVSAIVDAHKDQSHFLSISNKVKEDSTIDLSEIVTSNPLMVSLSKDDPDKKTEGILKTKRSLDEEDSYRHLLQNAQPSMAESFTAMLRGNQRYEETTKKPLGSFIPTGTTELDLHVAESTLIPGDPTVAAQCGNKGRPSNSWPRNCIVHAVEAPSTLRLRARVGVNWSGQYTLLLGARDDNLWDAPLQQCGPTASYNPGLRMHLRRSLGIRYGLYSSPAASIICNYYLTLVKLIFVYSIHRILL
ncbi:uncharacterized protein LOC107267733 isoform X1 [Cephus cinctus]|uniref:Uncharacterized protein LOC107267733 isoform X1 n=1 Tax=Cephus cinctus TaxID=211228 RepID=A0AAJ7BVF0_CEPCN|nr:uncharacterized protein LOC107267733 isoform X1 [Cephus cinctus]